MSLSVGEVAGIINIAIVLLQFSFPLLLVYIVAGLVPDRSNAATWSVAGRFLNGSWWPTILRTDTAATSKVSVRVILVTNLATIGLVLLAAAAVLTPLGLYDTVTASSLQAGTFKYAQDASPLGQATMARDQYNTSRICGWLAYTSCPGQNFGFYTHHNESGTYLSWNDSSSYISTAIPENLTEIFSSGRHGNLSTVATPFDIQYRAYHLVQDQPRKTSVLLNTSSTRPVPQIDMYAPRTVGELQYGDTIILADGFVVKDGIVADMKKGGLGFRNHTIPAHSYSGSDWTEGLLWLEPETVCVPNNISIELRTSLSSVLDTTTWIVDDGGIVDRISTYPYIDLNDTQRRPELYARAHKGAVLVNYNLRKILKVSSQNESYIGKKFRTDQSYKLAPGKTAWGTFDSLIPGISTLKPDPRDNVTLMTSIGLVTSGYGGLDVANFSHIANDGGMVLGAMVEMNTGDPAARFDPGLNWTAPLFACSTSIKAFIMDVTFFMNGTSKFDGLQVRSAVPRAYGSNATTPLWAVENTLGMNITDVQPIWGLVNDSYELDPRLWTIRRDHMYLPAGSNAMNSMSLSSSDSLACGGPLAILNIMYGSSTGSDLPDYTGSLNLPLKRKWQGLSKTPSGIATMMGLIWTDVAANYLTSARSQLNSMYDTPLTNVARASLNVPTSRAVDIQIYSHQIRYRIPYAIAGIVFLALYLAILIIALLMCVTRRSTVHLLKTLLNQTSVGRAVTLERHRPVGGVTERVRSMTTSRWISEYGSEDVGIVKERRRGEGRGSFGQGTAQEYQAVEGQSETAGKR